MNQTGSAFFNLYTPELCDASCIQWSLVNARRSRDCVQRPLDVV